MKERRSSNSQRIEIKRRIDRICDELESQWAAGADPDIAEYARPFHDGALPVFLAEIVKIDRELNGRSESELRQRYGGLLPDATDEVNAILDDLLFDRTGMADRAETLGIDYKSAEPNASLVGQKIGEYAVEKQIGLGGFGVVYLARDNILHRRVVIKIPRSGKFQSQQDVDAFLQEARHAALLNHENILRVLHVGLADGMPYIVQEFFAGGDLSNALKKKSFSMESTVEFVAKVSSAIGYAHQNRIIHRDLKPANILIKSNGDPVVADFGLALKEPHLTGRPGELAGTIQYMSPEQVRGEAHRLDGRSDIWSIGVILYLMLVNRHPFEGRGLSEIQQAILFGRPCPPRQLNHHVSRELDRICLKCLALRVSDRYSTAFDLADDLAYLQKQDDNGPVAIEDLQPAEHVHPQADFVPKGLLAFDQNDRDFFLDLLPGPRSRDGVPESIRFWQSRIDEPTRSQPVGLIYGPSGCGKSSLVNAGLLPRLAKDILVVSVEATPHDTEVRLLKGLRNQIPSIPQDQSLPQVIAGIRRGQWLPRDRRLLLVFDQFEQWLHGNTIDEHAQLIDALRHCDGQNIQALILVRDDFWMAISRFFRQLEIELVERHNFANVDLFTKRHAMDVLTKFGQAYGRLPARATEISESQQTFLEKAVDMIAYNDVVICVHCVLLAETLKNQPWEVETLPKIGGAQRIGSAFLEQVLGEGATNPRHRFHRQPLLAVLECLLPDAGVEIKGSLRSRKQLAQAAKLDPEDADLDTVLQILDSELRLITPTEPDAGPQPHREDGIRESYYQLTHDYLVPSLRDWMHSVRGRSRRGRARLRLRELANQWEASGQQRFLPSLSEYCSIATRVPRSQREPVEAKFMQQANHYYGLRTAALMLLALALGFVWWKVADDNRRHVVQTRIAQLMTAGPDSVRLIVDFLKPEQKTTVSLINDRLRDEARPVSGIEKSHLYIGRALLGVIDDQTINFLLDAVPDIDPRECLNLVAALSTDQAGSLAAIAERLEQEHRSGFPARRLKDEHWARLQILRLFLQPEAIDSTVFAFEPDPTRRSTLIHVFGDWHGDLRQAITMLQSVNDPGTMSALCIMLGRVERGTLAGLMIDQTNVYDELRDQMQALYQGRCGPELGVDAGVHGASRWALNQWGEKPTVAPLTAGPGAADWWVNDQGITMVRIDRGDGVVPNANRETDHPDRVPHEFAISACEITVPQWMAFLNDPDYPEADKPIGWTRDPVTNYLPNCAVNKVSKHDALLYCNWLSKKHGLLPCYDRVGEKPQAESQSWWEHWNSYRFLMWLMGQEIPPRTMLPVWKLIDSRNGYRLPSHNEWEMAVRGGSASDGGCTTDFYFAHDPAFKWRREYFWGMDNSLENGVNVIHPVAQKIPNRLGLFDALGNVQEICWGHPSGDGDSQSRTFSQGGGFMADMFFLKLSVRFHPAGASNSRSVPMGFRIARTIDDSGWPSRSQNRVPSPNVVGR